MLIISGLKVVIGTHSVGHRTPTATAWLCLGVTGHGKDVFDKKLPAPALLISTSSGDKCVATDGVTHTPSQSG